MTIRYDPQKVTDWLTPLEEVYARQSQQLERYHDQLRERDRQEEEATLNVPEMFAKLAEFSTSISKVVEARKTKQDADFKKKLDNLDADQLENLNTWFRTEDRTQLKEDHNPYIKTVGKSKDLLFGKKLKDLSPREIMLTKKYLANINTKGYTKAAFEDEIEGDVDRWNTYQNADGPTKAQLHEEWMKEKNSHLRLSDGLFASSQAEEMRRMASTSKTTGRSKAKAQILSTEQLKFKERTKLFFENPDPYDGVIFIAQEITDRAAFLKNIPGGKTAIQQATEAVVNDIYDLGQAGEFSIDKLNKLFTGELKDHPAAKNIPDAFFDKEGKYYTHLTKGVLEGETVKLNKIKAEGKFKAVQLLNKGYANGFKSQAEFDAAALPLKSIVDSETWKELEKFNFVSQSQTVYNRETEHFKQSIVDGTFLTKSNLDRAKDNENTTIVSEVTKKQNEILESQKTNKFPSFETRNKSNDSIVMQDSKQRTLGDGEVLGAHTWKGQLSTEITKYEDLIYMKYYNENPKDTNITARVAADMATLKKEKGFGILIGQEGAGEWSKDENGNYPNFVRSKIGELSIIDNESTWEQNFTTKWEQLQKEPVPGVSMIDNFLNTPGAIISPEEIIDIVTSDDPQLSPKFIYKVGKIPNKPKGKALIQITEALINSNDPKIKELVKNSQLKNKLKELITPDGEKLTPLQRLIRSEEFLTELIDETANPDTIQLHKRAEKVGFENLTPKEKIRLINGVALIEDLNLEKEKEETRKMQTPDTQIGRYNTRS